MEKLEFSTIKGEWLLVDDNDLDAVCGQSLVDEYGDYIILSEITEEQASEVVDSLISGTVLGKLFTGLESNRIEIYQHEGESIKFIKAVNCLHSLIKSKGVHLFENPEKRSYFNPEEYTQEEYDKFIEAEANTFYNPILFKKQ